MIVYFKFLTSLDCYKMKWRCNGKHQFYNKKLTNNVGDPGNRLKWMNLFNFNDVRSSVGSPAGTPWKPLRTSMIQHIFQFINLYKTCRAHGSIIPTN